MSKSSDNTNPEKETAPAESGLEEILPVDVMRGVLEEQEWTIADEGENFIRFGLALATHEVDVICVAEPGAIVQICVRPHIRAQEAHRPAVGELLHRLNFSAQRKVWEMDYDDGEIRLALHTDLFGGPLDKNMFSAILGFLCNQADTVFPYFTAVANGQMAPDFAADQALAAISKEDKED